MRVFLKGDADRDEVRQEVPASLQIETGEAAVLVRQASERIV